GAVAGISYFASKDQDSSGAELALIRESLAGLQGEVKALGQQIAAMESHNLSYAAMPVELQGAVAGEGEAGSETRARLPAASDLQSALLAALAEDRRLREEQQEQEREQRRQEMEQRRQEAEAMREGPYDRYNLKVNSVAALLSLTDPQKESYYAITKKYNDQVQQMRDQMRQQFEQQRQQRQQEQAAGEGGEAQAAERGRGGRDRGGFDRTAFDQMREQMTNLQNNYVTELGSILSAQQLETYTSLPESSQSFMNTNMASTTGDDRGGMFGGMMGAPGGRPDAGRQMGGAQGGRGGRGGR
ncbi:MAG: hypothetical protein JXA90_13820, partial [Planctomycetes bacterium]|nr:hypothetical protein [Planctomycetota bacterium]